MGENRNAYRVMVAEPEENRPLGVLDIGDRIILKQIFCNVMSCCPGEIHERFGKTYCFHFQGQRVS